MGWLRGTVGTCFFVSSLVCALWGALFLSIYLFYEKKVRRLALWGAALLALSLQPVVQALPGFSLFAACALFWLVHSIGTMLILYGLVSKRPAAKLAKMVVIIWSGMTVLALGTLAAAISLGFVDIWLASAFFIEAAAVATATAAFAWINRNGRQAPLYAALLLFASTSVYEALSLLISGSINNHGELALLNSLALSNAMSCQLLLEESNRAGSAYARMEALAENTTQGLAFLDRQGNVLQINTRMLDIFGVGSAVSGRMPLRADDIGLDRIIGAGAAKGTEAVYLDFDKLRKECVPTKRMDMARLAVTVHSVDYAKGQPGLFVQIDDVTERERELSEILEKRYRMELVLKAADAHEYSIEGGLLTSESWLGSLGYSFTAVDALEFEGYVHPQDRQAYSQGRMIAEQERGQTFAAEIRIRKADGNYVWYYVSSRDVTLNNKSVTLGMAVNIDLHKRTERYLMQSDKLAAVGQLANGVAHDINNHLMTIQTSLGLLTAVTDEVQKKKFASYMQEAIANSTGMLKRLVNFSKGDEGDFSLVAMDRLVIQSKELLERSLYREAAISLTLKADREFVMGNYFELQNVILNIGLNARDALPEQGGGIDIRTWAADYNPLKPGGSAGWYCIAIRDNGCGMSGETQKRIFDPFFTTKPQGKGSGLGLFTAYGNLERHGGTISVESVLGKGTEFVVAIPLADQVAVENNSQQQARQMI